MTDLIIVFIVLVCVICLIALLLLVYEMVKDLFTRKNMQSGQQMAEQPTEEPAKAGRPTAPVQTIQPVYVQPVAEQYAGNVPVQQVVYQQPQPRPQQTYSTSNLTLEEKYNALPKEAKRWYNEIVSYAAIQRGARRQISENYETYKISGMRLIRLSIRRGIIKCEFPMLNDEYNYEVSSNRKQVATVVKVNSPSTVKVAKYTIDKAVAHIAEERKFNKQTEEQVQRAQALQNEQPANLQSVSQL
jgi:hypothetical protein